MENTNECIENGALTPIVDKADAQKGGENSESYNLEDSVKDVPEGEAGDDDATMDLIKRFPKVCARIEELMKDVAETTALELIEKGLTYDDAVAEADKEGYLRGKNEKIELVKNHRMPLLDADESSEEDTPENHTVFPRYRKRSVWDEE